MKSNKIIKIIPFLFLFFVANQVFAQNKDINTDEYCMELIGKGITAFNKSEYALSIKYYTEAEDIAIQYQCFSKLFDAKNGLGAVNERLSNYGEAMKYYNQAINIATKKLKGGEKVLPLIYNNIGVLYVKEKDFKNALLYFNKSFPLSDDYEKTLLGINMSDLYTKTGRPKEAKMYLERIKKLPMEKRIEQMWRVNFADALFVEGKLREAKKILLKLLDEVNPKDDIVYGGITKILSKIYARQNDIINAIEFAEKGLKSTSEIKERTEFYEILSKLYLKKEDYDNAFKYKDLLLKAKDSLSRSINSGLLETTKAKLQIRDYQTEAIHHKERQRAERNLFIIIIILCLSLFFFIYRGLKTSIIKQKQEKIISENNQRIADLELDRLNNNLAEKNRKLSANALYLSGRNQLIEEIINSLIEIPAINFNVKAISNIKTLKEHLNVDEEWDDFLIYFEQVNPEFLKTLQNENFQFTASEIRFICYMYMNLDMKEISTIFNITIEAAKKRKQRIAKKLDIDMDLMYEHLLKIA